MKWHLFAIGLIALILAGVGVKCAIDQAEERGRISAELRYQAQMAKKRALMGEAHALELKEKADELRRSTEELDKALESNRKWIVAAKRNRVTSRDAKHRLERFKAHGL